MSNLDLGKGLSVITDQSPNFGWGHTCLYTKVMFPLCQRCTWKVKGPAAKVRSGVISDLTC